MSTCAVHDGKPGDAGTCSRCGSFMCAECRQDLDPTICRACLDLLDERVAVARIPVFAILLMIHGGLIVALGLLLLVYAVSLGWSFGSMPEAPEDPSGPFALLPGMMVFTLLGETVLHVSVGAVQLFAGYRALAFRGRGLAIGAISAGMLTALGCYCLPTSVVMLVWGLVVLLRDDVRERFAFAPRAGM